MEKRARHTEKADERGGELTVGMIRDSDQCQCVCPLLSLNLRLMLANTSALREHNLSSLVTIGPLA